ncbi:SusC/RagA family TonB-linked outer membrane protein [Pedobacter frigidisoli]|nr:SusC/RagA family TonB-linked outer membrane protein [Pedobacter frigidisoli]
MKLTTLLLIMVIMQVNANSFAQKITLKEKNSSLENVFQEIRNQTGFDFMVTKSVLENARPVNINVTDADLIDVLNKLFKNQSLEYEISDNSVLIRKREVRAPNRGIIGAFFIDVRGRIVDEQNVAIPSATIRVKGSNRATIANSNGNFTLIELDPRAVLVISAIGYQTREVAVIPLIGTIKMSITTSKLDEVQVIAYGTTTQRTSVGSISKVTSEEIASQSVSNPLLALQGRVAGLLVTSNSGIPGSAVNIQIRGQNTIGSSAVPVNQIPRDNPLFIIDGIPFAPQNASVNRIQGVNDTGIPGNGLSPFNSIDPSNIESIEVLKDADATSIYGARGANGVILITTKQGVAGKTKFTGAIYAGVNTLSRVMPLLNTSQYLDMRREAYSNDGVTPTVNPGTSYAPDLLIFDTNRYTDYLKAFYGKNSSVQNGNLALSGGDARNTFNINVGYNRQTYMFPGDFTDNKINGNIKLRHTSINKKFVVDLSTGYSYDKNNVPGSASILSAFTLPPNFPDLVNPDGSLKWDYKGINFNTYNNNVSGSNAMAYLKRSDLVNQYNFLSSMLISYEILPGLKIKSLLGYNTFTANEFSTYPVSAQNPSSFVLSSVANKSINNFYTWDVEPQISYDRQIGKGKLNLLVGGTLQKTNNNYIGITGTGFSNDLLLGSISSAKTISISDGDKPYKYNAGFGRVNYIYDDKYIVDLTGRFDGSSRFAPGKQWGNFGSMAAGWIFSNEKLFKDALPFVSFGKFRASYGTTGNDNVGSSLYTSNWSALGTTYLYNGGVGYLPKNLENPNFSWSTTRKLETALDLGFLNDRIIVSAAWFRNRSSDQLIQYQLPSQAGFDRVTENFQAVVQNKGWEFVVSGNVLKPGKFDWKTAFNLTVPENKLLSFPGLETSSYSNYLAIGQPMSVAKGYKYVGVNPTTGIYEFLTAKGDVTSAPSPSNGDNKFIIGNTEPDFYGGWRNTLAYKGVQFDIFFEFRKQQGKSYMSSFTSAIGNQFNVPLDALNVWRNPGDQAEYQRLTSQTTSAASNAFTFYRSSDGVYTDASYIRLKTVGLTYALRDAWIQKLGMSTCRLYVNAQNLLTITNYKGNDPETQSYYNVPPIRTVAFGLNFGL